MALCAFRALSQGAPCSQNTEDSAKPPAEPSPSSGGIPQQPSSSGSGGGTPAGTPVGLSFDGMENRGRKRHSAKSPGPLYWAAGGEEPSKGKREPSPEAVRMEKRFEELVETEGSTGKSITELIARLNEIRLDERWNLKPEQGALIERVKDASRGVGDLHNMLLERLTKCPGKEADLEIVFESMDNTFIVSYTAFQSQSATLVHVLQKQSGGRVVGDSAVGISGAQPEGSLGAQVATVQELLSRPTLRLMRYQLYIEEMKGDAKWLGEEGLAASLGRAHAKVKDINHQINENIRFIQRRERVGLIAARVRAAPPDVRIQAPGREFILDTGGFMEAGREGYRSLYLFNDAILVVKPGKNMAGKLMGKDCDLKFKRLIPLTGLTPETCPVMQDKPNASPGGATMRDSLPSFSMKLKAGWREEKCTFYGRRDVVLEWVTKIKEQVEKLAKPQEPIPAWRLSNEPLALSDDFDKLGLDLDEHTIRAQSREPSPEPSPVHRGSNGRTSSRDTSPPRDREGVPVSSGGGSLLLF